MAFDADKLECLSTADIKAMVEEINMTEVSIEDQLSNNIYQYDGQSQQLEMCNEQGLFVEHTAEELKREMTQDVDCGISMGGN